MHLSADELSHLLRDVATVSPDIENIIQDEIQSWAVRFLDDGVIHLALREQPARLELMASIGNWPSNAPEEFASLLLMFNFLSKDTGGARMGLSAHDRRIYLVADLPRSIADAYTLRDELRRFATLAANWCDAVAHARQPQVPAVPRHVSIDRQA